jgi:hypothetical protein
MLGGRGAPSRNDTLEVHFIGYKKNPNSNNDNNDNNNNNNKNNSSSNNCGCCLHHSTHTAVATQRVTSPLFGVVEYCTRGGVHCLQQHVGVVVSAAAEGCTLCCRPANALQTCLQSRMTKTHTHTHTHTQARTPTHTPWD